MIFSSDRRADGFGQSALKVAMDTLFEARKIKVEEVGPPSKRRKQIIVAERPIAD